MNKFLTFLLITGALFLGGCEVTREVTISRDGTGTIVTTTDMSSLIGMAKMAGQSKELDDMDDKAIDTVIALASIADSIPELSADERALVKKGTLNFAMNMAEESFVTKIEFPFTSVTQITNLDKLTGKVVKQAMKKQMEGDGGNDEEEGGEEGKMPSTDDVPDGSIDDYFITTYAKGKIQKKLDTEKHAKVGEDEGMNALKEMSAMGAGTTTLIFNLPSPAKKAEGKNVKLSEDKKRVTITTSSEDFFDDATALEFLIEY